MHLESVYFAVLAFVLVYRVFVYCALCVCFYWHCLCVLCSLRVSLHTVRGLCVVCVSVSE